MVLFCAEIGVNWRDLDDMEKLIEGAARAGFDIVKIQMFSKDQVSYHPRAKELQRISITDNKDGVLSYIVWLCKKNNVELAITPMRQDFVAAAAEYADYLKVKHADRNNENLISACLKTGKHVIISCDGGYFSKVTEENPVPFCVREFNPRNPHIWRILCIPEYPPKNLQVLLVTVWSVWAIPYHGFSSHVPMFPAAVLQNDMEYLEIHVKLDKYEPHWCPIDQMVSVSLSECAAGIKAYRLLHGRD